MSASAIASVTGSDGSLRASSVTCCSWRIRLAGSGSPTGTVSRCKVILLPQPMSPSSLMLIGMTTRRDSTAASWRSWYLRSPPVTAARKATFRVASTVLAAFFSASVGTSIVARWRVIARSRMSGDLVSRIGAAVR